MSSCDLLHSTNRNYFEKLWARCSAKKSPVERKSLERQYKAARQALMGKTPPHHTLLFQRGSVPAPIINGLHYFTDLQLQGSSELYEDFFKTFFGTYSEKRNKDSHVDMKFSALFKPCQWSKDLPFEPLKYNTYSRSGSEISDGKEDQAPKELHKSSLQHEKGSIQYRRHQLSVVSCVGSNTKPTLPPIPQGRKYSSV